MISQARAKPRALLVAILSGASLGVLLGGSYLAGAQARMAASHERVSRLEPAAAAGFSNAALKAEAASLPPGALAEIRRHDSFTMFGDASFTNAGAAQRGDGVQLAKTVAPAPAVTSPSAQPALLHASLTVPAVPARIGHAAATHAKASDLDCLTQAVYYESRGESAAGQAAVAQVVLNRVRHAGFPKTVCGVVFQGVRDQECQFSFACDGSQRGPKEEAAWRKAHEVAARALGGFVMAQVGDATHFHVASLGAAWSAGLVRVAQIGAHTFYTLTGRHAPASRDLDGPAPSEKPVYTEAKASQPAPVEVGGSSLILASAVAPSPMASAAMKQPAPASSPAPTTASRPAAGEAIQTEPKDAG